MTTYRTKADAAQLAVIPALGGYEADYDVEAITEAAFAYDGEGYSQIVDEDTFWEIVAQHETN